jgi:hypothetical protein
LSALVYTWKHLEHQQINEEPWFSKVPFFHDFPFALRYPVFWVFPEFRFLAIFTDPMHASGCMQVSVVFAKINQ